MLHNLFSQQFGSISIRNTFIIDFSSDEFNTANINFY